MKELDASIRSKFDSILARVKEPQSELSLAELGILKKFSYHAPEKTIVAHLAIGTPAYECPACFAVNEFVVKGIERDLATALEEEFPGWTIQFVSSQLKVRGATAFKSSSDKISPIHAGLILGRSYTAMACLADGANFRARISLDGAIPNNRPYLRQNCDELS